jgi:hypothetical protein
MGNIPTKLANLVVVMAAVFGAGALRADMVYDNSVNDRLIRFGAANGVQIGDEVTLAGTSRRLTNFSFEYFGTNFSGNESARLRIYENNGPLFNGVALSPGNQLYDSGLFPIVNTLRSTVNFDWATLGPTLDVPNTFTWTVEFTGIDGAGESAGLDLYAPVVTGSSFGDYWQLNGANWVLLENLQNTPINFAARIEATVPEPGPLALLAIGGLLGTFVWKRRRND